MRGQQRGGQQVVGIDPEQRELFTDEAAAVAFIKRRFWPNGPVCPHCGSSGPVYPIELKGRGSIGVEKCGECRLYFTVRGGTFLERSTLPLHKWLHAIWLVCGSPEPVSAYRVGLTVGISRNRVVSFVRRIKEARERGDLEPLGYGPHCVPKVHLMAQSRD